MLINNFLKILNRIPIRMDPSLLSSVYPDQH